MGWYCKFLFEMNKVFIYLSIYTCFEWKHKRTHCNDHSSALLFLLVDFIQTDVNNPWLPPWIKIFDCCSNVDTDDKNYESRTLAKDKEHLITTQRKQKKKIIDIIYKIHSELS